MLWSSQGEREQEWMLTGETPARAFLDWAHFFLLVSEETGLAVLAGFHLKRRAISQRRPGAQRLRRKLIRRAARRAGISYLLGRYQTPGDVEGSISHSSFLEQPVHLVVPGFRTGFKDKLPLDPPLSAVAWQQFCEGRLSAS